jgi:hypothetical protein
MRDNGHLLAGSDKTPGQSSAKISSPDDDRIMMAHDFLSPN